MNDLRMDYTCQNFGLANAIKAELEIGEKRQADILVLAPVGRIDNLTSAEFRARQLGAVCSCSADVVIDFSRVEYISSCGLRALMTASGQKSQEWRLACPKKRPGLVFPGRGAKRMNHSALQCHSTMCRSRPGLSTIVVSRNTICTRFAISSRPGIERGLRQSGCRNCAGTARSR